MSNSIKKLAIFVEGHAESLFMEKLVSEFFNKKSIILSTHTLTDKCPRLITLVNSDPAIDETKYDILIYNSCTDNRVVSDMIEQFDSLKTSGCNDFIGIRDLYPDYTFAEKNEAEQDIQPILDRKSTTDINLIFATMEVETWFLAELEHYNKINPVLTLDNIKENVIDLRNLNSFEEDIEEPAKKLNDIYQIASMAYKKKSKYFSRTIESLDYENLYANTQYEVKSLNKLFTLLDNFIS